MITSIAKLRIRKIEQQAVAAERLRIGRILDLGDQHDRISVAKHLAFHTQLSVDDAALVLTGNENHQSTISDLSQSGDDADNLVKFAAKIGLAGFSKPTDRETDAGF